MNCLQFILNSHPGQYFMVDTIKTEMRGKLRLRTLTHGKKYCGTVVSETKGRLVYIEDDNHANLWKRLEIEADQTAGDYFGWDGARSLFLHFFPDGFETQRYLDKERAYKLAARAILDSGAPLEEAKSAVGLGKVVLAAFQKTQLVHFMETQKIKSLLAGPSGDAFINASARFASGEGKSALESMAAIMKPYECASWSAATLLPFLWRPDTHMFLNATKMVAFAERVGHPFWHAYRSKLDYAVYESLLDLAKTTRDEIQDFRPKDAIDTQGFIWTVAAYDETDAPPPEAAATLGKSLI